MSIKVILDNTMRENIAMSAAIKLQRACDHVLGIHLPKVQVSHIDEFTASVAQKIDDDLEPVMLMQSRVTEILNDIEKQRDIFKRQIQKTVGNN